MPERTGYPHGVPCWVDLATSAPDAAAAFYGGLFGWEAVEAGPAEETGGYRMFALDGKLVAGLGPLPDPSQPPVWNTYVAVDDADAVAASAAEAGGQVVMGPMDVMDAGRMAFLVDPVGAFVGVWQAGRHAGAQLVNEPGAPAWNELICREPELARPFYATVFGWEATPMTVAGVEHTVFNVDGRPIAGVTAMTEEFPAVVPSHWMTYFAVEDADAAAARAEELGGTVSTAAFDAGQIGRIAILMDPMGTAFSVIATGAVGG